MADETANPLAGISVAAIADELGDIDAVVEPLLERRTLLRKEASRRRLKRFAGERWQIDRTVTSPLVVDVPAIQARMGETWIEAFRKGQIRVEFAIAPRAAPPESCP